MIKVVWLCPYNINHLKPEIKINRNITLHNASWILNLANHLALLSELELHIITYSPAVSESQVVFKDNIYFHVIKYSFPFTNKGFPWYLPLDKLTGFYAFSKRAKKAINQIKPDILHVHGTEGGYFIPTTRSKIPCILSIQGIIGECMKHEPSFSGYLQLPYERYAIWKTKLFGCRTIFDSSYIKKHNKKAVIFDLPEAINNIFFQNQWNAPVDPSLLFVGSIIKRKGIEDLIAAIHLLKVTFPDIKLKIIGAGTEKYINYLNLKLKKLDIVSNILWLGNRNSAEIAFELSKAKIFVLPTLIDNSPNSLAEAMAAGVPCIATRVGGIPSMIEDGYDGLLFQKNNIPELANLIKRLINDTDLQERLSKNGRKTTFSRNYAPKVSLRYFQVYKQLVINNKIK